MAQDPVPPLPKSSSNVNGCIIGCLIVFVIGVAGVGIATYATYRAGMGMLDAVTEAEPRELPEVTMTDEESQIAAEKFKRFQAAIESEDAEEKTYSFTGQEINVLLRSPDTPLPIGKSVFVTVKDGELQGEVSLNLGDLIPVGFFQGRYVNGAATFSVSAEHGRLNIYIESLRVKGEEVPEEVRGQLRQTNFAENMNTNPNVQKFLERIKSISVEGDQLLGTLK